MIEQSLCNSYGVEALQGIHRNDHIYKIALFTSEAVLNKNTKTYNKQSHEVENGRGYEVRGQVLLGFSVILDEDTACLSFKNPIWPRATIRARGALIYNDTLIGLNSVCVLDFGEDVSSYNDDFKVFFPLQKASSSLVRIRCSTI